MPEDRYTAVPVADGVFWVGAVDWALRNFHGYATRRGSTYNAYLVVDESVALIDTVKRPFLPVMIERIRSVIDPGQIDFIVSNHAEMDHSGALPEVVQMARPKSVIASRVGVDALRSHFHWQCEVTAAEDLERLNLGSTELVFLPARMLHWPESMFTFIPAKRLLFSQDAFGMHLATRDIFAERLDPAILRQEAKAYFANILMPYASLVRRKLDEVQGLKIDIIAPDHGPIWQGDGVSQVLQWYRQWSEGGVRQEVVVVYDTMWGSTALMADAVADGITAEGVQVRVFPLSGTDRSDVATACLEAAGLVVGSPTLNGGLFPTVADVLSYLAGLRPPVRVAAMFGSYGWAEGATRQVKQYLETMKARLLPEVVTVKYVPDSVALERCTKLGREVARAVKETLAAEK